MPADRWPDAATFAVALTGGQREETRIATRRRAAAVLAIMAGAAIIALQSLRSGSVDAAAGPAPLRSLALRAFSFAGDSAAAIFAVGMVEGLEPGLVRISGISVRGQQRVAGVSDEADDDVTVGRALGVDAVLSGDVRVVGATLRVTPRLTRVSDGTTIWTDRFDADLADVFSVQDSMAVDIVAALVPALAPERRILAARGPRTSDQDAYAAYLRGRRAMHVITQPSLEEAIRLFTDAVTRDSTFADAWAALGDAYGFLSQVGSIRPVAAASLWRRAAEKAIRFDSANGYAFAIRGLLRAQYDWDWDGALQDFRHSIAIGPSSPDAMIYYAALLNVLGAHDSALAYSRRAVELDPTSGFFWTNHGFRYRMAGFGDSAVVAGERAFALDSTQWLTSWFLSGLYYEFNRPGDGAAAIARARRLSGDAPAALAWLSTTYGATGQRVEARRILAHLTNLSRRQYVPAIYLANAKMATGDTAGALVSLEESVANRDLDMTNDLNGGFAVFSGNPRYEALRNKVFGDRQLPRGIPTLRTRPRTATP